MDFKKIQKEIIDANEKYVNYKDGWDKYNGSITMNQTIDLLKRIITDSRYEVIGPNAFVEDYPNEFDIIVADKNNKKKFGLCKKKDVNLIFEVKRTGIFGSRGLKKLVHLFNGIKNDFSNVIGIYLSFYEDKKNFVEIKKIINNSFYFAELNPPHPENTNKKTNLEGFTKLIINRLQLK